jgi:ethanolaminephosphotransferase
LGFQNFYMHTHVFRFSLNMWLYSTCDNVDGRQARRTHSSSPLGELFDHGVDSLSCSLGCVVQMAAMASGTSFRSAAMFVLTTFLFYLSTWEHFYTGVLYLGPINGPTEGIIIVCCIMLVSSIAGPMFWHQRLSEFAPVWLFPYVKDVVLIDATIFMSTISALTLIAPMR